MADGKLITAADLDLGGTAWSQHSPGSSARLHAMLIIIRR
jgi:hypothetical protein